MAILVNPSWRDSSRTTGQTARLNAGITTSPSDEGYGYTVALYCGNTELDWPGKGQVFPDTSAIVCDKAWFAAASSAALLNIPIRAVVTVQTNSGKIITGQASFTLYPGADMGPTVSNLEVEPYDAEVFVTGGGNECYVYATVSSPVGTEITEVKAKVPSGSSISMSRWSGSRWRGRGYNLNLDSAAAFTVTATDARGLTGSASVTVPKATYKPLGLSLAYDARNAGQSNTATLTNTAAASIPSGGALEYAVTYGGVLSLDSHILIPRTSLAAGTKTITIPTNKSWFDTASDKTHTQMSALVVVSDGKRPKAYKSFKLNATDDMKPVIGAITVTPVSGSIFVSGITRAAISAVVSGPTLAEISSVTAALPGGSSLTLTKNASTGKWEGTTSAALTTGGTVTITATDERGMTASKASGTVKVWPRLTITRKADACSTGESIGFTLTGTAEVPSGGSLGYRLYYGNTALGNKVGITAGKTSLSVACTKALFDTANIRTLNNIKITIVLSDGVRADVSTTFTLNAGADMAPGIGAVTAVPSGTEAVLVEGYSRVKISATITHPTKAIIMQASASLPGGKTVTLTEDPVTGKWEGTAATVQYEGGGVTITAKDERGLTATKENAATIKVWPKLGADWKYSSRETGRGNILYFRNCESLPGGAALSYRLYCGSTPLTNKISLAAGTTEVTIPLDKTWFTTAQVSDGRTMTVKAVVSDGKRPDVAPQPEFTLTAGSDMKPTIGAVTVTPVATMQDAEITGIFISGYAKAKVSAVINAPTNAAISSASATLPDGRKVPLTLQANGKWEGTSTYAQTVSGKVSVTAADQRGLSATKSSAATIAVIPYTAPVISVQQLYRCDQNGTQNQGGQYARIKATAQITTAGVSGNAVKSFTAQVSGQTAINLASGTAVTTGGLQNSQRKYTITLRLTDKVGVTTTRTFILRGEAHDVAFRHNTGGGCDVGIGMLPVEVDGRSTVQLPAGGEYRVDGHNIANYTGVNLTVVRTGDAPLNNNILTVSWSDRLAACNENRMVLINEADFRNWSNLPPTIASGSVAFWCYRQVVFAATNVVLLVLWELQPVMGRVWLQFGYINSAGTTIEWRTNWKRLTPTADTAVASNDAPAEGTEGGEE